jgi:hypothetical protein
MKAEVKMDPGLVHASAPSGDDALSPRVKKERIRTDPGFIHADTSSDDDAAY